MLRREFSSIVGRSDRGSIRMHQLRNGRKSFNARRHVGGKPLRITCSALFWIRTEVLSCTSYEIGIVGSRFVRNYLAPCNIRGFFFYHSRSGIYLSEWIATEMKGEGKKTEKNFLPAGARKRCHLLSWVIELNLRRRYIRHTHLSVSSIPNNYFLSKRASSTRSISRRCDRVH